MKKVISIILLILLISILVVGCGNDKEENIEANTELDVKTNSNEMTMKNSEMETVVTTDMKKSVDLPEGYPENIIPIYDDLFLVAATKKSDGSFSVVGLTKDELKKVVEFYQDVFKDANVMTDNFDGSDYIGMGDLKDFTYTIIATEETSDESGYKTSISIVLMPGSLGMEMPTNTENND